MTIRALLALALLAFALHPRAETVEWRDANWFTGTGFVAGDRYSEDGIFLAARPAKVDRVVDLGGRHVVPPYGDAHHHGIDSNDSLDDKIIVFLEAGIFYVKNPNVIPDLLTPDVRARLNRRHTLDIVFANGGLTSPGGHPVPLHEYLASLGVFQGLTPQQMEGRAWFTIADEADLDAKWPRILAARPDFIKTFLLFSEEFEGRKPLLREDGRPNRGLDPRVLRAIVARAHAAGLRVTTHIDTARDFENAVDANLSKEPPAKLLA